MGLDLNAWAKALELPYHPIFEIYKGQEMLPKPHFRVTQALLMASVCQIIGRSTDFDQEVQKRLVAAALCYGLTGRGDSAELKFEDDHPPGGNAAEVRATALLNRAARVQEFTAPNPGINDGVIDLIAGVVPESMGEVKQDLAFFASPFHGPRVILRLIRSMIRGTVLVGWNEGCTPIDGETADAFSDQRFRDRYDGRTLAGMWREHAEQAEAIIRPILQVDGEAPLHEHLLTILRSGPLTD